MIDYKYRSWISGQIKKLKKNIAQKHAFTYKMNMVSIEQLSQMLPDKFKPEKISTLLEGNNFMEFHVFSTQGFEEFIEKNGLGILCILRN
ncbi:MAG: hypothetical protein GF316_21590 [Candidatus Lokiarchaeota archaeon]|nr:hypothetical protein [Candidatus Lokiarchaeota archaeon]